MTRQLAMEGGQHGIRANSISPGLTETNQTREQLKTRGTRSDARQDAVGSGRSTGGMANVALFLASDESFVRHRRDIVVDGGMKGLVSMPRCASSQVSRPGGPFEMSSETFQSLGRERSESKCRRAASVIPTRSPRKDIFQASPIRASRSRDRRCYRRGRIRSASVEVGQHVGVGWLGSYCGHCDHAVAESLSRVRTSESRASRWMADIRTTCWFRSRGWHSCREGMSPVDAGTVDVRWHHHVQLAA